MKRGDSMIRVELERLAERSGGELRPDAVVDAARDAASPLHGSFNWDDTEAAHLYRLHQARHLITAVVRYEPAPDGKSYLVAPVFVSLTADRKRDGAGYRLLASVLNDEDRRAQLLADARAEMQAFRHKYQRLTELARVFSAMADVEAEQATAAEPIEAAV